MIYPLFALVVSAALMWEATVMCRTGRLENPWRAARLLLYAMIGAAAMLCPPHPTH